MSDETTEAGVGERNGYSANELAHIDATARDFMGAMFGPHSATPDAGDASEGLTPTEWEAITEASWNGGSKAWRAEVERTIAAREAAARADERGQVARTLMVERNARVLHSPAWFAFDDAARIARSPR